MRCSPIRVMPAIYKFNIAGQEEESRWGWHRATELWEVISNLLGRDERASTTPIDIGKRYPFIEPKLSDNRFFYYTLISSNGVVSNKKSSAKGEWLHWAIEDDCYIPAKLGLELIKAIKNPALSAIRRAVSN